MTFCDELLNSTCFLRPEIKLSANHELHNRGTSWCRKTSPINLIAERVLRVAKKRHGAGLLQPRSSNQQPPALPVVADLSHGLRPCDPGG